MYPTDSLLLSEEPPPQPATRAPVKKISARCPDGDSTVFDPGCLKEVTEEDDGDFSVVFVQNHNGYMR